MDEQLTIEQQCMMRVIALEAENMSKEELIRTLLSCWEGRFRQKQIFVATCRSAGFAFRLDEGANFSTPESLEDLEKVFGYVPTDEEADEYIQSILETATMELDMDAIVLESYE